MFRIQFSHFIVIQKLFKSTFTKCAPLTHPNVWIMSITTIPKANADWKPLTGWAGFHDIPPIHPKNINIAVPINSAKNMASVSSVFFPILLCAEGSWAISNVRLVLLRIEIVDCHYRISIKSNRWIAGKRRRMENTAHGTAQHTTRP